MMRGLLITLQLCAFLGGCGPEVSSADKSQQTGGAEAGTMAARAEAARERNSKVTRPPRRFTEDSL